MLPCQLQFKGELKPTVELIALGDLKGFQNQDFQLCNLTTTLLLAFPDLL